MSNPRSQTPTQKEIQDRERQEREREEEEKEKEKERLPDDATVDVEAEKKESNSDEILDKLDKELIGLKPVKQRIREISASWWSTGCATSSASSPPAPPFTCPSPAAPAPGRPRSPGAWPSF